MGGLTSLNSKSVRYKVISPLIALYRQCDDSTHKNAMRRDTRLYADNLTVSVGRMQCNRLSNVIGGA